MSRFPEIVCTSHTCAGSPRIDGTRLNVYNVISTLHDASLDYFLENWDYVPQDAVRQAVEYCRSKECKSDAPDHYCAGCTLRTLHDGETFEQFLESWGVVQTSDTKIVNDSDGSLGFMGTLEELHEDWQGRNGWEMAAQIANELKWNDDA